MKDDFNTEELSQSTSLAEHHYIHVSIKSAVLYNWHLCCEDDSTDLDKEALMIYKKIVDSRPQPSSSMAQAIKRGSSYRLEGIKDNFTGEPKSDNSKVYSKTEPAEDNKSRGYGENERQGHSENEAESDDKSQRSTENEPKLNNDSQIYRQIDSIFKVLEDRLTSADLLPDEMLHIHKIFSFTDTGGQRAFLELLPLFTIGTALYLVFFSYGAHLKGKLTDKYQGPTELINLKNNEYTQIKTILQTLTCVSTKSFAIPNDTSNDATVAAVLVGTHTDNPSEQPGIDCDVDTYIETEVKNFLSSGGNVFERVNSNQVLERVNESQLVLRVNNKTENNDKFEEYRKVLMNIIKRKFSHKAKLPVPGSWLMFSIMLRKMKLAGRSVLPYQHCKYIASKLYIPLGSLDALLSFMHKDLGILMYFPEVPGLNNVVICDPGVVFTSISKIIINTFSEDDGARESLHFKEYAVFAYQKVDELIKEKRRALELSQLTALLQYVGIIAPIEFCKPADPPFKCTLDHNHEEDAVHCIHSEYIIPCILKGALDEELATIEEHCKNNCMIAPLIITFKCNFAPMGAFCYLFTKLIKDQTNWKPHLPDINSPNDSIERMIRRNKVTFVVKSFYVTLVSTSDHFKVFIHRPVDAKNQPGYEFVCNDVKKAIKDALSGCLNPQVNKFNFAFPCTEHTQDTKLKEHLMVFDPDMKNGKCKHSCTEVNSEVDTLDHAIRVWFQVCIRIHDAIAIKLILL